MSFLVTLHPIFGNLNINIIMANTTNQQQAAQTAEQSLNQSEAFFFKYKKAQKALNGDSASFKGFVKLADEFSSTAAGNLANLYAGLCYAKLNKWEDAAKYLEEFDGADDQMISPAAEGALGNAYAHLNQLDKAVSHLKSAAEKADNNSLSPTFLIQAGEILESQGKNDEALKLYQEVKEKYFNSMAYQTIDGYIERVSSK